MNIQKAAEASGLSADTIRFYERKRILPPPLRQSNGYRTYGEEHLLTLRLANGLRRLGVPLNDVASILKVAHDETCGDIRGTMLARLTSALLEIDSRINKLTSLRDQVTRLVDGLESMTPGDQTVSGTKPCSCVRLVAEGS